MRKLKIAGAISSIIITAFLLVLLISPTIRSQITQISGLAVAQSPLQWNNVKDAAVGDAQTSGLLATGNYIYDPVGATWNRMRGSASGIITVIPQTSTLLTLLNASGVAVGATNDLAFVTSKMTWELVVNGALATQSTNLEGSIDGTNFYVLDVSTSTSAEMRHVALKSVRYVRGNCTAQGAGGGSVTVRFIGGGN